MIRKCMVGLMLALASTLALAEAQFVRTPYVPNWDQIPLEELARQAGKYPTFHLNADTGEKVVALSFDDGPGSEMPALLDVLKRENVKVTFFWLGKHMEAMPDVVKRAKADGHAFGNHSWDHPKLSKMTGDDYWQLQLKPTQDVFQKLIGYEPLIMRPPYGFLTDAQVESLARRKMHAILWSVTSDDWFLIHQNKADPKAAEDQIVKRTLDYVHPGAIVLMHDAPSNMRKPTVAAAERIIKQLKADGYRFATVPELLAVPSGK
ncbi:polysaccharide deacetylase family protein [Chitinilyticum litopenaei]|uniref:polysaccharide deacetylase family protein n=1 Tax=Chitinilyticum litopenaei TaxID=1121276 RepID=UPI00041EE8E7|nr:polysaccharide deacetylase family protein [Chitinilyticum litopenaei]